MIRHGRLGKRMKALRLPGKGGRREKGATLPRYGSSSLRALNMDFRFAPGFERLQAGGDGFAIGRRQNACM